jgi:ABC-type branched-subunit amino acid transport system substrate-binding protein
MKKEITFLVLFIAVLIFVFISHAGPAYSAGNKVKVAALLDFSGHYSQFGRETRQAMELGLEETKNIEVHFFDTKGDLKTADQRLTEVIAQGDYQVVVTLASWITNGLAAKIQSNHMLQMAVGSAVFNHADQKNCVRFTGDVRREIQYLTNYLKKYDKVAVMYFDNDYGLSWNSALKSALKNKLVKSVAYNDADTVFTDPLQAIRAVEPDALVLISTREAVQIVKQASAIPIRSAMFGARPTLTNPLLAEPAASGLMFSYPDLDETLPIFAAFKNKYGYRMSAFGAEGYDLITSLDRFCSREKANKSLFANYVNRTYDGALGHIQFNQNAQADYNYAIFVIKNNSWEKRK